MAYGNGPNTKPKQSKGNTMGGDSLNWNVDGGGNNMGGGDLNQPGAAGGKSKGYAGYPHGFGSTPIPTNEQ